MLTAGDGWSEKEGARRRKDLRARRGFVSADIQWPDLHKHMPNQPQPGATEAERQRVTARNINENPALAAYWFYRRWNLFFTSVLKPLFRITEWWFRYEWQHRGSSHVHGLFWMKDAPSPDKLDIEKPDTVEQFLSFWSSRVSAVHPGMNVERSPIHPSAMPNEGLTFTFRDLAQMLNRVQRHTKCTAYCLRRPKGSDAGAPMMCRFKFPKDVELVSELEFHAGKLRVNLKRNDPFLNQYTSVLCLGWRASVDVAPCTDP